MSAVNASAQISSPHFRSAFEAYRAFAPEPLLPWKETNDTVGKIGGWRAYAKEASGPLPSGVAGSESGTANPQPIPRKH